MSGLYGIDSSNWGEPIAAEPLRSVDMWRAYYMIYRKGRDWANEQAIEVMFDVWYDHGNGD